MALMKPILPPERPRCCTCRHWRRAVGHALGACGRIPYDRHRDDEGRLVRESHRRSDEQFACHEPRIAA
jgi:hypothetical protein